MPEPTLYLFDGHNLFHAGEYEDLRQLRDELASFVALKGARGVLVFDGVGADESYGPLEVRYARDADPLLERLAAENRTTEVVSRVVGHRGARDVRPGSAETLVGDLSRRHGGHFAQRGPAAPSARHPRSRDAREARADAAGGRVDRAGEGGGLPRPPPQERRRAVP